MPNEENLKKGKATQYRSGKEAAINGRKGGIASGKARRKKRSMREAAKLIMDMAVSDPKIMKQLLKYGVNERDSTNQIAVIVAMVNKALDGNVEAAKFLRDTLGESEETPKSEKIVPQIYLPENDRD